MTFSVKPQSVPYTVKVESLRTSLELGWGQKLRDTIVIGLLVVSTRRCSEDPWYMTPRGVWGVFTSVDQPSGVSCIREDRCQHDCSNNN